MPFDVIPAIDLRGGRVVRLRQGDFAQESAYSDDPVAVAREWDRQGARWIHVVDLDGAREGEPRHLGVVAAMKGAVRASIQLGGGLRRMDHVDHAFAAGADRVILGTAAIRDPQFLADAAKKYWHKVALGLDVRQGRVAISGWLTYADVDSLDVGQLLGALEEEVGDGRIPLAAVIYTDISRDGMLSGPDIAGIRKMAQAFSYPLIASGGIASLEDIRAIRALEAQGVTGVIVGKALYEGALTLEEALRAAGAHAG